MSTIPSIIDALAAAVTAGLPGVQVWDGPPVGDEQDDRIVIGWSRTRPQVTATRYEQTFELATGISEQFAIPGVAISYSGNPDMKPCRDRAYQLLDAVTAAAAGLTGADASVAAESLTQEKAGTGVQALVEFTVTVMTMT